MAGYTPEQITTFLSAGTLAANKIVKFDSTANQVVVATAATEKYAGVTLREATAANQEVPVVQTGTVLVVAGGPIAYGDFITSGAAGVGVATTTSTNRYVGIARQPAVSGDLFEVELRFGEVV